MFERGCAEFCQFFLVTMMSNCKYSKPAFCRRFYSCRTAFNDCGTFGIEPHSFCSMQKYPRIWLPAINIIGAEDMIGREKGKQACQFKIKQYLFSRAARGDTIRHFQFA